MESHRVGSSPTTCTFLLFSAFAFPPPSLQQSWRRLGGQGGGAGPFSVKGKAALRSAAKASPPLP